MLTPDRRLILGLVFFFLLFMVFCTAQRQPTIESGNLFPGNSAISNQTGGSSCHLTMGGCDLGSAGLADNPTDDQDLRNLKEELVNPDPKHQPASSPCLNDPKYTKLGYDNPYIFPYQNSVYLNLNYPTSRYRYPNWCRQMKLDEVGYRGFPGYYY